MKSLRDNVSGAMLDGLYKANVLSMRWKQRLRLVLQKLFAVQINSFWF